MSKKQLWIEEAKKTLEGHEFKQLASWGGGGSEVWECSRPGSSIYAFTICITRMGIAILGDIDGLTFHVGSNYGMAFLAGDDVSYYIHSKLEQRCKATELNKERYLEWVTSRVADHIRRLDANGFAPDWLSKEDHDAEDFEKLKDYVYETYQKLDVCHPNWDWFHDCYNFLDTVDGISDENEAYSLNLDEVYFDWLDAPDIVQPSESLMFRLHLINEAAKRIQEQKEKLAEGK